MVLNGVLTNMTANSTHLQLFHVTKFCTCSIVTFFLEGILSESSSSIICEEREKYSAKLEACTPCEVYQHYITHCTCAFEQTYVSDGCHHQPFFIHTYIFISFHRSILCKIAFGYETCQKRKQTTQDIHNNI